MGSMKVGVRVGVRAGVRVRIGVRLRVRVEEWARGGVEVKAPRAKERIAIG